MLPDYDHEDPARQLMLKSRKVKGIFDDQPKLRESRFGPAVLAEPTLVKTYDASKLDDHPFNYSNSNKKSKQS